MSLSRKFYIICMFLSVSMSANAVQRCVALNSDTACEVVYAASGDSNFVLECDGADGTSIEVQGIGVCTHLFYNVPGDGSGALSSSIIVDDISIAFNGNSVSCACKLIAPVESKWAFGAIDARSFQNPLTYCVEACGKTCADVIATGDFVANGVYDPNLRSALFGNLE